MASIIETVGTSSDNGLWDLAMLRHVYTRHYLETLKIFYDTGKKY